MIPARPWVVALTLLGALAPVALPAQVCGGFPSLVERGHRIAGSLAVHPNASSLAASLTVGRKAWGSIGVGRTRDGELDASTLDVSLEAGADLPIDGARRLFVCPIAALSAALGPHDFLLSGANYDTFTGALGFIVAPAVERPRAIAVLPYVGLRFALDEITFTPSAYARREGASGRGWYHEIYGLLSAGLGLTLGQTLTIRPELIVPFGRTISHLDPPLGGPYLYAAPLGRDESETTLRVSVGFAFGRRP